MKARVIDPSKRRGYLPPGTRFGRLAVIEEAPRGKDRLRRRRWSCRCDCGQLTIARAADLTYGTTRSCGCLRDELVAARRRAARRAT